ncbi:MAG TPA: PAS domain S-box protein [Candidatus Baltobacteraceae bacterium]|nr:PAS domain S-box protein [Candidatus Baltobacteraceae bacterium]
MPSAAKILVVDDDPRTRFATLRILRDAGYEALEAATGAEGLTLARQGAPHLILVNLCLPDMGGPEVCMHIREDARMAALLVVLVSSKEESSLAQTDQQMTGIDGCIARSGSDREFLARIEAYVRIAEAEAKLREHEEKYRQLFHTVSDAIVIFDATTRRVIDVNKWALGLYGYTHAEFLSLSLQDLTIDLPASEASFRETLAGHRRTVPLRYHRKKDGTVFPVEIATAAFLLAGQPAVCGVIRDITDRQRAEAALQRQTHQLRERVKELNCLYELTQLVDRPNQSVPDFCQGLVNLIPAGWQYPEKTGARLVLNDQCFTTGTFRETPWRQTSAIAIHDQPEGTLEVHYLDKPPTEGETPFLPEEQTLLNELARRVGKVLERWRAEAAVRQSESLFHALAEVSPVGIFRTDAHGNCGYVNERWCEIAGIAPEQAMGEGWAQAIHPADREHVFTEWYASAQAHRPFKMEYRFQRPDGLETWVMGQAMREPPHEGETAGYVGAITDITDRKRAEEALRESEGNLNRAQRVAQVGSWTLDVSSQVLTGSDEFYRILGFPTGAPLTFPRFLEAVHPDDRRLLDDAWKTTLARGRSALEYRIVVGGETKWISGLAEAEFDAAGIPQRGVGTIQDITKHWQMDEELRARTRQLDALRAVSAEITRELNLPALFDLIVRRAMELVGGAGGTIYLWTEESKTLTPRAWVGHRGDWVRNGQVRLGEGLVGLVAERRSGMIVNNYRTWPHARPFILEQTDLTAVVAEPLLCRDRLFGVIAIDDHDAGRRFAERDLDLLRLFAAQAAIAVENAELYDQVRRHTEELERNVQERTRELQTANADLEAFSSSVTHDLRVPLVSIDGFSRRLDEKYSSVLDDRGKGYLQQVRAGAQRMGERIEALWALAQVSRQPLLHETVNLSATARAITRELGHQCPDRVADVRIEENLVVQGDARLLRALLENLLGNAWKFTAYRSPARIELGRLIGDAGEAIHFVRDNGAGFDMARADQMFHAFQRLHSAQEFPGTGIGLATVERIIRRHGGRVWAEGVVDGGATVYFTIGTDSGARE